MVLGSLKRMLGLSAKAYKRQGTTRHAMGQNAVVCQETDVEACPGQGSKAKAQELRRQSDISLILQYLGLRFSEESATVTKRNPLEAGCS
jgi:hypothetical protein